MKQILQRIEVKTKNHENILLPYKTIYEKITKQFL